MNQIQIVDLMRYFVNFYDYEHKLIEAIRKDLTTKQVLFIAYKNSYMSVGRNFKAGNDEAILAELLNFKDFEGDYVNVSLTSSEIRGFFQKTMLFRHHQSFYGLLKMILLSWIPII